MAILKIARMGHPVLKAQAEPVADPKAQEIQQLVRDMIETLEDVGGIGLAAPQVHVSKRVVIFYVPGERRAANGEPAEDVPLTVLINPEIEPLSEERVSGVEACLSVPGLAGPVPRWSPYPLPRARPARPHVRARGQGLSCPRRAARMRSPRRHSLSDAHDGSLPAGVRRGTAPLRRAACRGGVRP